MKRDIRLMVVDDSDSDIFCLKRGFQKAGIEVRIHELSDGQSAIDYLSGSAPFADWAQCPLPNLMILDIRMPGLDGFDVLQWVRAQSGIGAMPIIMLSSSAEAEDVDKAHQWGANSYLVKPHSLSEFTRLAEGIERYWFQLSVFPTCRRLAKPRGQGGQSVSGSNPTGG